MIYFIILFFWPKSIYYIKHFIFIGESYFYLFSNILHSNLHLVWFTWSVGLATKYIKVLWFSITYHISFFSSLSFKWSQNISSITWFICLSIHILFVSNTFATIGHYRTTSIIADIIEIIWVLKTTLGSGALPGLILDLELLNITWRVVCFHIYSPCGTLF